MPLSKTVFKEEEHIEFLHDLGYDLEQDINALHPKTKSFLLHDAVNEEQIDIVRLLIANKADVNKESGVGDEGDIRNNRTPLFLAILLRNEEIVKCLLENGADPGQPDKVCEGLLPLTLAAACVRSPHMSILLLEAKAKIHEERTVTFVGEPPRENMTALMQAFNSGNISVVSCLLEQGARLVNSKGENALIRFKDKYESKRMEKVAQELAAVTKELTGCASSYFPKEVTGILSSYTPGSVFLDKRGPGSLFFQGIKEEKAPEVKLSGEEKAGRVLTQEDFPSLLPRTAQKPQQTSCWFAAKDWTKLLASATFSSAKKNVFNSGPFFQKRKKQTPQSQNPKPRFIRK